MDVSNPDLLAVRPKAIICDRHIVGVEWGFSDVLPNTADTFLAPFRPDRKFYRSSRRRSLFDPEQQIIIVLFAAFSASVRIRSRWSGTPSKTLVSQVPQMPSVQE